MKRPVIKPFIWHLNNYLLVLSPPRNPRTSIIGVKKKFASDYPLCAAWGKPHITLISFTLHEKYESRIKSRLRQVAMNSAPIKVELKGYGRFQTSYTIFINIVLKSPIQNLVRNIRSEMRGLMKFYSDPHFIMEPHLTIARKISPSLFDQAWLEYSHRLFSGSFIADSMVLLKQVEGKNKYETVCDLHFESHPGRVQQCELFA